MDFDAPFWPVVFLLFFDTLVFVTGSRAALSFRFVTVLEVSERESSRARGRLGAILERYIEVNNVNEIAPVCCTGVFSVNTKYRNVKHAVKSTWAAVRRKRSWSWSDRASQQFRGPRYVIGSRVRGSSWHSLLPFTSHNSLLQSFRSSHHDFLARLCVVVASSAGYGNSSMVRSSTRLKMLAASLLTYLLWT